MLRSHWVFKIGNYVECLQNSRSPLQLAIIEGRIEIVNMLLAKYNVDVNAVRNLSFSRSFLIIINTS
jgi:hypothetical protein